MTKREKVPKRTVTWGKSSVMAVSDRRVTVCGCRRVETYTAQTVRLALCDLRLEIEGEELSVSAYCGEDIEVSGSVRQIRFLR